MSRLVLSTKKSLYRPIEIEIDGKVYKSVPLSTELMEEMDKLGKAAKKRDLTVGARQLELVFNLPRGIAAKLDLRDINYDVMKLVADALFKPKRIDGEPPEEKKPEEELKLEGLDEKNGPKPGDESSS